MHERAIKTAWSLTSATAAISTVTVIAALVAAPVVTTATPPPDSVSTAKPGVVEAMPDPQPEPTPPASDMRTVYLPQRVPSRDDSDNEITVKTEAESDDSPPAKPSPAPKPTPPKKVEPPSDDGGQNSRSHRGDGRGNDKASRGNGQGHK